MIDLLPHRPPFRFVDSVLECVPGRRAVARWCPTGNEEWFGGHFPGHPIVPGVLQVEALAQTAAVALLADESNAGRLPMLAGVEGVRFPAPAGPGDELTLEAELETIGSRGGWGTVRAHRSGTVTCRGRLFFVWER